MGFFDKKFCDFCGEKIGLFGNNKLEDGNMCNKCAANNSPFLTGRRNFTVSDMKNHHSYREENKAKVAEFNETKAAGNYYRVRLDEDKEYWLVSCEQRYKDKNPDILSFNQFTGCSILVDEDRNEIMQELQDGTSRSYNPPRYEFSYDVFIVINVNHPWFSEIRYRVNRNSIVGKDSYEYSSTMMEAEDVKKMLQEMQKDVRERVVSANKPKTSVTCLHCGATTLPDSSGCCEYCGGAINK